MAATSPYSPNDYAAVSNYRPYELPVNDILKAYVAQNAFWDAGAARVKSVHDNALNLKLSLEPNKKIRDQYMEDARKQLAKLSTMDLSNPSVQREGFSLFKPLFQDEGILYDDLTTRHYEKVRNEALAARSRDNGKGFSDINFQYAMDGYNEFLNSKDRMAGKDFYEKRKEYTPFYDYTEDFSKALKDCRPSSIETQSPEYGKDNVMTGYLKDVSSRTLSAAQARGCLEAGLNGNAQRQLQIEGSVAYKNNAGVLASDTITYLNSVGTNLSTNLEQLAAKKHALEGRKDLTPEMKIALEAQLDSEIKSTQQELDRTTISSNKLKNGDMTDLLNNYDQYAGSIYSFKKLYKKALASAFEDTKVLYKADPIQLNAIRFSQEVYLRKLDNMYDVSLEEMKNQFDREQKLLDLMYGGGKSNSSSGTGSDIYRDPVTGEITINPNLMRETGNISDKPTPDPEAFTNITKSIEDLNIKDSQNNLRLYNSLIARGDRDQKFRETMLKGFNMGTSENDWTRFKTHTANNRFGIRTKENIGGIQQTSWFRAYFAERPDDEDANKWANENLTTNVALQTLNRKFEIAEAEVAKRVGGNFNDQIRSNLKTLKPVTLSNGRKITPEDIQSAIEGKPSNGVSIEKITTTGDFTNRGETTRERTVVKVNGQVEGGLTQLYQKVRNINEDINSKLKSTRADVYGQMGFDREPWYFTPSSKGEIVDILKGALPKNEKGEALDIRIQSSDFSGGVKVAIPNIKKGSNSDIEMLRNTRLGTSVEIIEDGVAVFRGTKHNLINQAINNPVLADAAYQLQTITESTSFKNTQPGAKVKGTDIKIPVYISGKRAEATIETYNNNGNPEFRLFIEGATDPRAKVTASNPYELFEKIARLPIDLNQPVR